MIIQRLSNLLFLSERFSYYVLGRRQHSMLSLGDVPQHLYNCIYNELCTWQLSTDCACYECNGNSKVLVCSKGARYNRVQCISENQSFLL